MSSSEPQDQPPDNEDPAPSSDPLEQQQNADTSRDANNNGDPNGLSTTSNNLSDDPSPPSSSSSPPLILYRPPTIWGLLRGAAINLILPFVNGLMMGFGELLAHEAAFRLGWSGTRVCSNPLSFYLKKRVVRVWLSGWGQEKMRSCSRLRGKRRREI